MLSGSSATWPSFNPNKSVSQYRDYQFELLTSSGSTTFDGFAVQLSAQLRTNTVSSGNSLRATLWAGPIIPNPLLSNSLITLTAPNSAMTASGFSSVLLTGSTFTPQTSTTSPATFFFRVWAANTDQNSGYMTKMAANQTEFQAVTMAPAPAIDAFIEYDLDNDGLIDDGEGDTIPGTRDGIVEVVPEPSSLVLGAGGIGLAAIHAWRRRRRRPAA